MTKNLVYIITALLILVPLLALAVTGEALADSNEMLWDGGQVEFQTRTGLGDRDPREIASQAVNVMLGFIGIVAVIIIMLGGFRWMTSGGSDDKVDEAKRTIGAGMIGLIIILSAYAVAQFILNALYNATGATG